MVELTQSGAEADAVVAAVRTGDEAAFGTLAGTGELLRLTLARAANSFRDPVESKQVAASVRTEGSRGRKERDEQRAR
jgi:hypothetical protein